MKIESGILDEYAYLDFGLLSFFIHNPLKRFSLGFGLESDSCGNYQFGIIVLNFGINLRFY